MSDLLWRHNNTFTMYREPIEQLCRELSQKIVDAEAESERELHAFEDVLYVFQQMLLRERIDAKTFIEVMLNNLRGAYNPDRGLDKDFCDAGGHYDMEAAMDAAEYWNGLTD